MINIRYIVSDVESAIVFYTTALGFALRAHPAPGFAALEHDGLFLYLNEPGAGGAGSSTSDGSPAPGGWNRFQMVIEDLDRCVTELRPEGASFRSGVVEGWGKAGAGGRPFGQPR